MNAIRNVCILVLIVLCLPAAPIISTTTLSAAAGESLLLPSPITPQIKNPQSFLPVSATSKVSLLARPAVVVTGLSPPSSPAVVNSAKVVAPTGKPASGQLIEVKQAQQVTQIRIQQTPPPASPGGATSVTNKKGLSLTVSGA